MILYTYTLGNNTIETFDLNDIPEGLDYIESEYIEPDESEYLGTQLALLIPYPKYFGKDITEISMDNLCNLTRKTPISNKGIKAIKEYFYEDILVWSIKSIYWFETENPLYNPGGIIKVHTWYNVNGTENTVTTRYIPMSDEDKKRGLKDFRDSAITYLQSANEELFSLLYTFFSRDIAEYILTGNKNKFEDILTDASLNHLYEAEPGYFPVRYVLSMEVPKIGGGTTTVLQGILHELL